jgi:hypothetical protein
MVEVQYNTYAPRPEKAIIFYNLPSVDNLNKIIFLRVLNATVAGQAHSRAHTHRHTFAKLLWRGREKERKESDSLPTPGRKILYRCERLTGNKKGGNIYFSQRKRKEKKRRVCRGGGF